MALKDDYAFRTAMDLLKTGIQSGSIKLHGTGTHAPNAAQNGTADAAYITSLLEALVQVLPNE